MRLLADTGLVCQAPFHDVAAPITDHLQNVAQRRVLVQPLDKYLHMQMQAAAFLALYGPIDSIDTAENAALWLCVAPEQIHATCAGDIAIWALGTDTHAKEVSQRQPAQNSEAVRARERVAR